MPIVVNVVPQAEFDAWLKSKKTVVLAASTAASAPR
jgi:heme/copper-type cytochrome/quinol oxidase subunit 2